MQSHVRTGNKRIQDCRTKVNERFASLFTLRLLLYYLPNRDASKKTTRKKKTVPIFGTDIRQIWLDYGCLSLRQLNANLNELRFGSTIQKRRGQLRQEKYISLCQGLNHLVAGVVTSGSARVKVISGNAGQNQTHDYCCATCTVSPLATI